MEEIEFAFGEGRWSVLSELLNEVISSDSRCKDLVTSPGDMASVMTGFWALIIQWGADWMRRRVRDKWLPGFVAYKLGWCQRTRANGEVCLQPSNLGKRHNGGSGLFVNALVMYN